MTQTICQQSSRRISEKISRAATGARPAKFIVSCYPLFELHPGTAEDPWTATQRRPAAVRLTSAGVRLHVTALPGAQPPC